MAAITAPSNTGKQVNELIIQQGLSAEEATRRVLGNLQDQYTLPQGATIISSGINDLVYKDAQGFTHRIQRQGDANSPDFGRVQELSTDRPEISPLTQQIPGLDQSLQGAIGAVNQTFANQGQLATLPPEVMALLESQSTAERSKISSEAEKAQGNLIASLFSKGTQESSLATGASTELSKAIGELFLQQQSAASQRQLQLQQFLSELGLSTGNLGANFIGNITGQETQRATAGAQIGLGREQLDQQAAEAARNFMLQFQQFQASQNKSKLPGILSAAASIGLAPFTGGTSLLGLVGPKLGGLIGGSTPPTFPGVAT